LYINKQASQAATSERQSNNQEERLH